MESNAVMPLNFEAKRAEDALQMWSAIQSSYATIEFTPDGTILEANQAFLNALEYSQEEIRGRHHRMFVEKLYADSLEYRRFWDDLAAGKEQTREFKRITKSGTPIWIKASYMPVKDQNGRVVKVIKLAQDNTAERLALIDFEGKMTAIGKVQAIIEFNLDGSIITANENFLATMGYSLKEIQGQHHSMFADDAYRLSPEYQQFWAKLNRGEFVAGEFKRMGKGSKEVWINASYNPILNVDGKPFKVVKYATNITERIKLIQDLSDAASELTRSSSGLGAMATQMTSSSKETSAQATQASATAQDVSKGVDLVATNTEEMQASIKEIARNANEASNMSNATKNEAQSTNRTIQKLGDSSREIGNVIKVISSIAQQTNLLALNATIEAARAGDAGRGFAVVANEVKELAKQTAKATEEITSKIGAIQNDSSEAVTAISGIGISIDKLNSIAGAIAASVEEQSATTGEVARVVKSSSKGVQDISASIQSVSAAAVQSASGADEVLASAKSLQELAARLQEMVKRIQQS